MIVSRLILRSILTKQPVFDNRLALWSQDTLRMELDAMDVIMLVAQAHDATIIAHRRHIQALWETSSIDHPRMITTDLDTLRHTSEYRVIAKLRTRSSHSMIYLREVGQLGTERLSYRLMPQANAEHWFSASVCLDDIHQKPCFRWNARTWTQYNLVESI